MPRRNRIIRMALLAAALVAQLLATGKEITRSGYIITLAGDTVGGTVVLPMDWLGLSKPSGYHKSVRFRDSGGMESDYLPDELKGYGICGMPAFSMQVTGDPEPRLLSNWSADSNATWHFESFLQLPMTGAFGTIRMNAFLMRRVSGCISMYYLNRVVERPLSTDEVEEHYLWKEGLPQPGWAGVAKHMLYVRRKGKDLRPLFADWPEAARYVNKPLSLEDVCIAVLRYNEWARERIP